MLGVRTTLTKTLKCRPIFMYEIFIHLSDSSLRVLNVSGYSVMLMRLRKYWGIPDTVFFTPPIVKILMNAIIQLHDPLIFRPCKSVITDSM